MLPGIEPGLGPLKLTVNTQCSYIARENIETSIALSSVIEPWPRLQEAALIEKRHARHQVKYTFCMCVKVEVQTAAESRTLIARFIFNR